MKERIKELLAGLSPEQRARLMDRLADEIEKAHPGALDAFVEDYQNAGRFRDYLSEGEAELVVDSFTNYDGSTGAKWSDAAAVFRKVREMGGDVERDGDYNRWALFTVLNMIYSDYGGALRQYLDGDRLFRVAYLMAQAWFEDKDRSEGHNLRWYLGLQD